jgi:hypothetical protein
MNSNINYPLAYSYKRNEFFLQIVLKLYSLIDYGFNESAAISVTISFLKL